MALILGPVVWFVGFLLRYLATETALTPAQQAWAEQQDFAGPGQLIAYHADPGLVTAAYAVFALGAVLMFPACITLGQLIGTRLAYWGAMLIVVGLFARLYFTGADQTAFQLTETLGVGGATQAVMAEYVDISYGPWRVPVWCSVGQYAGTMLLVVAAWRTGLFGTARAVIVLLPGLTWMGVLKAATIPDLVTTALLAAVLLPLGLITLRHQPPPTIPPHPRRLLTW
ncbi:hypothetical protein ACIBEJ_31940 [Nonomuraea sp. NPDC050790]|uniref:hypothetical protein n=1 Tax=Nonomuraea sp. NPDC050790 TaxID=3364371 RepID=UPI0037B42DFB